MLIFGTVVENVCTSLGATGELDYVFGHSPTINDHNLYEIALDSIRASVGNKNTVTPNCSGMGGEDFSHFGAKMPICFIWVGVKMPDKEYCPIHNGGFDPDEKGLQVAAEVMARCALNYLRAD